GHAAAIGSDHSVRHQQAPLRNFDRHQASQEQAPEKGGFRRNQVSARRKPAEDREAVYSAKDKKDRGAGRTSGGGCEEAGGQIAQRNPGYLARTPTGELDWPSPRVR